MAGPGGCGRQWAAELEALTQRDWLQLPSQILPLFYGAGGDWFALIDVFNISLPALA